MFQISKRDAVALSEGYGFLMAAGWNMDRLTKKTAEMQKLILIGEFSDFETLDERLQTVGIALSKAEDFEIVQKATEEKKVAVDTTATEIEDDGDVADEEDEDEEEGDEADEEDEEECILKVRQRVLVSDEEPWKGTISSILNSKYVEVEDRKGEVWEVAVTKCEVLKLKGKPVDAQEEELRALEAQVRRAKAKAKVKVKKAKKVTRGESIFRTLETMDSPLSLKELAEKSNRLYAENGGTDNALHTENSSRFIMKILERFGVFRLVKGKFKRV